MLVCKILERILADFAFFAVQTLEQEMEAEKSRSLTSEQEEIIERIAESLSEKWRLHRLIPKSFQKTIIKRAIESLVESFVPENWHDVAFGALGVLAQLLEGKSMTPPEGV